MKLVYVDGYHPLSVKVLTTPEQRAKGFMGQKTPPGDNEGLLFMFESSTLASFHMRTVPWDIEAMGFDSNNVLVEVLPLKANDARAVRFSTPVSTVIEVLSGWSRMHSLTVGKSILHDTISLSDMMDAS